MAATPPVSPDTSTGSRLSVVVPSPSWPWLFPPQHFTPPSVVTTHVLKLPTAIAATSPSSTTASTGVVLGVEKLATVLLPSWPRLFVPQHLTPPALVRAHV